MVQIQVNLWIGGILFFTNGSGILASTTNRNPQIHTNPQTQNIEVTSPLNIDTACSSNASSADLGGSKSTDGSINTRNSSRSTGKRSARGYLPLRAFIQKPQNTTSIVSSQIGQKEGHEDGDVSDDEENEELMEIDIHSYLGPTKTWHINNDFFEGELCLLIRDHPNCNYDFDNEENIYFELQFQGKFKRKPRGALYMAIEMPQKSEYKLSWPLKAVINASIKFIKSWGYEWIHMSYGGGKGGDTPHLSSPAFQAFDRIVITPDGSTPPPLGYAIPECGEDVSRRKSFQFNHTIDTCCTYTMSFNHTYVDVVKWRVCGIPVVKSFKLFVDDLRLVVYEIDEDDDCVDSGGDVQAIPRCKVHRKKEVAMWVHFRKDDLSE